MLTYGPLSGTPHTVMLYVILNLREKCIELLACSPKMCYIHSKCIAGTLQYAHCLLKRFILHYWWMTELLVG
jgi:hypothetical protein